MEKLTIQQQGIKLIRENLDSLLIKRNGFKILIIDDSETGAASRDCGITYGKKGIQIYASYLSHLDINFLYLYDNCLSKALNFFLFTTNKQKKEEISIRKRLGYGFEDKLDISEKEFFLKAIHFIKKENLLDYDLMKKKFDGKQ